MSRGSWQASLSAGMLALLGGALLSQTHSLVDLGPSAVGQHDIGASYDPLRDRIRVVWGTMLEFDGSAWGTVPSNIAGTSFDLGTFDRSRGRSVHLERLFSGIQTWEWDGGAWLQLASVAPAYALAPICYHAGRQRVIAHVWRNYPANPWFELWEWDGVQWTPIPNSTVPFGSDVILSLEYDEDRDKLVAFGMVQQNSTPVRRTLEWDAQSGWAQVQAGGPTIGIVPSLTYDASRRTMVLGVPLLSGPQIWERRNGGNWTLVDTGNYFGGTVVYDSKRRRCVSLNSVGNTLAWTPIHPAQYDLHGQGCTGSLGMPTLSLTAPWTLPRPGQSLEATLDHLPLGVGAVLMGFDDQAFGPLALPHDLSWLGAPGCALRASAEASVLTLGSGLSAPFSLAIPAGATGLVGATFYQQGVSFDPGQNALGLTLTNSMLGRVGL